MSKSFVLQKRPVIDWPVLVKFPGDGGTVETHQFMARLAVLPHMVYAQRVQQSSEGGGEKLSEVLEKNAAVLPDFVTGWQGISDESGDIPVSRLPELILRSAYGVALSAALWRAIAEVHLGLTSEGAQAKNSVPSPAPGQQATAEQTNSAVTSQR